MSEWSTEEHVAHYLERADTIGRRDEGERELLAQLPPDIGRVLDLGTGDGRLLALVLEARPKATGVGLDLSPPMLAAARERFAAEPRVELAEHDFAQPLPALGSFDAVVSCFAIHHVEHERKRELYAELFELLPAGGVFCNLEHVSSPSQRLRHRFCAEIGYPPDWEDPSNRLLDVETQLGWLREIGFADVDCMWKWREMALLAGVRP